MWPGGVLTRRSPSLEPTKTNLAMAISQPMVAAVESNVVVQIVAMVDTAKMVVVANEAATIGAAQMRATGIRIGILAIGLAGMVVGIAGVRTGT